jgi:hypothetical protein
MQFKRFLFTGQSYAKACRRSETSAEMLGMYDTPLPGMLLTMIMCNRAQTKRIKVEKKKQRCRIDDKVIWLPDFTWHM